MEPQPYTVAVAAQAKGRGTMTVTLAIVIVIAVGLDLYMTRRWLRVTAPQIDALQKQSVCIISEMKADAELVRIREKAERLREHPDAIGVRVLIDGRWTNRYLSELPGGVAVGHAMRMLFDDTDAPRMVVKGTDADRP